MTIPLIFTPKIVGSDKPLRWWPGQPNSYGKTPHKKPLYRIIWSESRLYMLGGAWPDGRVEYRWVPYYGWREEWVLEKWLTPEEFCGSEQQWQREQLDYGLCAQGVTMYTMGPFPKQGWYEHCYSFPANEEPNLEAIVPLLESAKNISLSTLKQGLHLWHEKQRREWEQKVEDGILDAMPAFHGNPSNVAPSKPHGDTGGLLEPGAAAEAVRNYRGESAQNPQHESPEDLALPQRGMSIRQKRGN